MGPFGAARALQGDGVAVGGDPWPVASQTVRAACGRPAWSGVAAGRRESSGVGPGGARREMTETLFCAAGRCRDRYGQIVLTAAADRSARALELLGRGFAHLRERHVSTAAAWGAAQEIFAAAGPSDGMARDMPALEVVGEFTVPPVGVRQRDFQVLHIDFGLPIGPREPVEVARFTALYIDAQHPPTSAVTRVVALRSLLSQRHWSDRSVLLARLRRYRGSGRIGARQVEGILARLVEAADDRPTLPAPDDPTYRCGLASIHRIGRSVPSGAERRMTPCAGL
jgi:hypothetical protein